MRSDLSEARQQTLGEGKGQTADTCLDPGSSSATEPLPASQLYTYQYSDTLARVSVIYLCICTISLA